MIKLSNSDQMQSPDINEERLAKLKELYPDIFTGEGKLNLEEIKKIVAPESIKETEQFEFKWFGKAQAKRIAFTPSKGSLVYDENRSVNPAKANGNLIIEGENLEVLKLLLCSYREKIKCIYIDPPYNTGKDFVYSDNYTEDRKAYWEQNGTTENGVKIDTNNETDGRFHSNWLDMMYSRLLAARQLLQEDGVIFVSIDDNEVHHLRMLMNEIFGEENFIANVIWEKVYSPRMDAEGFSVFHDYIMVYLKNFEYTINRENFEQDIKQFNYIDENTGKRYRRRSIRKEGSNSLRNDAPASYFKLIAPDGTGIYPIKPDGTEGCWRWSQSTYQECNAKGLVEWVKNGNGWQVYAKQFYEKESLKPPATIWKHEDVGHTHEAMEELKDILKYKVFDTPKPTKLIRKIVELSTNNNTGDIILDFFAGSGATAHGVLELNSEDGGNRKFILVQLPEFTDEKSEAYKAGYRKISDITIERTKRVIEKMNKEQAENPGLFPEIRKEFGFKVYHLAKSAFPRVEFAPDPEKSEEENIDLFKQYIKEKEASLYTLFNEREIIDEVLLKNGFMLDYSL
ncbi:MAG: site-specific DNA-methyltransferase, partial [Acidobacteria bacterium]|nr:site-specific DNA-methyltransferase [Acidobacteriota bacterium]